MKSDTYRGWKADTYDKKRKHEPKWHRELELVDRLLTDGPVLDVPLGTGRFIPIYRSKGMEFEGLDISQDMVDHAVAKYGQIPYQIGSALDMPYEDNQFGTVVCIRLVMHLKETGYVQKCIDELQRVGRSLIISTSAKNLPLFRQPTEVHTIKGSYVMVKC